MPARLLLILTLAMTAACSQWQGTRTERSVVEQLLLSNAVDRALDRTTVREIEGRQVFLDTTWLKAYDAEYVTGALRDLLGGQGALVEERAAAEVVVEVRSGGLATDESEVLIGLPSLTLPTFSSASRVTPSLVTPEIPLFKRVHQRSVARLSFAVFDRASGRRIARSGPCVGTASYKRMVVLMIPYESTDLPELRPAGKRDDR